MRSNFKTANLVGTYRRVVEVMDFSAFNPLSTNPLNLAVRDNNFTLVEKLLKRFNPNCVDNRGWTSLHEAAANDSYESLMFILEHADCRPLAETFEGHTALFLACQKEASNRTILALLNSAKDIVNQCSTEMVSPLHVVSAQGRADVVQMLIEHGAVLNCQDYDGDTPLHDAALAQQSHILTQLLHADADSSIKNLSLYTALHLACSRGCLSSVKALYPFTSDINDLEGYGSSALHLAAKSGNLQLVLYLLEHNADPNLRNTDGDLAIDIALIHGFCHIFSVLLRLTNEDLLNITMINIAFSPAYFNIDIVKTLLESNLGHEFFNYADVTELLDRAQSDDIGYLVNTPMKLFLDICDYIFNNHRDIFENMFMLYLMRGVSVNPLQKEEWPPLTYYIAYDYDHSNSFETVFNIMIDQGLDVDYRSKCLIPDAFLMAIKMDSSVLPLLLKNSLASEPEQIMNIAMDVGMLDKIPREVQDKILQFVDIHDEGLVAENIACFVAPLKHLSRLKIRRLMRATGIKTTQQYFRQLQRLPLPRQMLSFLCYQDIS